MAGSIDQSSDSQETRNMICAKEQIVGWNELVNPNIESMVRPTLGFACGSPPTYKGAAFRLNMCRIPDDWIDNKRYPLFMARSVMRSLIDELKV